MASSCLSSCVNDAQTPVRARASYVNLYKGPDSDAEFIRSSMRYNGHGQGHDLPGPEVVDSISCRQLYLRSYTFSKKDEEISKCFGRVVSKSRGRGRGRGGGVQVRRCGRWRKVKEVSRSAFLSIFRRLLFCTTKVDVVN